MVIDFNDARLDGRLTREEHAVGWSSRAWSRNQRCHGSSVMPSTSSANAIASNARVDSGVSGPRGGAVCSRGDGDPTRLVLATGRTQLGEASPRRVAGVELRALDRVQPQRPEHPHDLVVQRPPRIAVAPVPLVHDEVPQRAATRDLQRRVDEVEEAELPTGLCEHVHAAAESRDRVPGAGDLAQPLVRLPGRRQMSRHAHPRRTMDP